MANSTENDLRSCRELRDLTQWAAAQAIGISEYTLARWEKGESVPEPDDVWRLEKLYKTPGLWHRWMRAHYESYRAHYPEGMNLALPGSVMNVRYQMMDVLALQDKLERDVLDGHIDDARTCDAYLRELDEMIAAAQVAKQRMEAARR